MLLHTLGRGCTHTHTTGPEGNVHCGGGQSSRYRPEAEFMEHFALSTAVHVGKVRIRRPLQKMYNVIVTGHSPVLAKHLCPHLQINLYFRVCGKTVEPPASGQGFKREEGAWTVCPDGPGIRSTRGVNLGVQTPDTTQQELIHPFRVAGHQTSVTYIDTQKTQSRATHDIALRVSMSFSCTAPAA